MFVWRIVILVFCLSAYIGRFGVSHTCQRRCRSPAMGTTGTTMHYLVTYEIMRKHIPMSFVCEEGVFDDIKLLWTTQRECTAHALLIKQANRNCVL